LAFDASQQLLHGLLATIGAGAVECGLGLFGVGGFDFPAQDFAAEGRQVVESVGRAFHEQDGPDVGTWEVLDQAGEQLDFGVGQGLSVVAAGV
jgi:hypothetical protein